MQCAFHHFSFTSRNTWNICPGPLLCDSDRVYVKTILAPTVTGTLPLVARGWPRAFCLRCLLSFCSTTCVLWMQGRAALPQVYRRCIFSQTWTPSFPTSIRDRALSILGLTLSSDKKEEPLEVADSPNVSIRFLLNAYDSCWNTSIFFFSSQAKNCGRTSYLKVTNFTVRKTTPIKFKWTWYRPTLKQTKNTQPSKLYLIIPQP